MVACWLGGQHSGRIGCNILGEEWLYMKYRQLVVLLVPLVLLGVAACHAALETIEAPEGTIVSGSNWFCIPALPYYPAPSNVMAGFTIDDYLDRWDPLAQSDVFYDESNPSLFGSIAVGDGYWLYSGSAGDISFSGFDYPADTDAWISLPEGEYQYTLIGIPFDTAVDWDEVAVTDGETSVLMSDEDSANYGGVCLDGWDNYTQSSFTLGPTWAYPDETETRPWNSYMAGSLVDNLALIIPANGELPSASSSTEISDVKLLPDDLQNEIWIEDCYVTYVSSQAMYLEQDNRLCAIRTDAAFGAEMGDKVTLYGCMLTDGTTGERYVRVSGIDSVDTAGQTITPLGMNNRAVGGGDWHCDDQTGEGQQGVTDGHGLNNIGLLVRTWGRVTSIAEDGVSFVIDDSTGNPIKCVLPEGEELGLTLPWRYFQVTGVVSCYEDNGDIKPQLLMRTASDLTILHMGAPDSSYTASVTVDADEPVGDVVGTLGSNVEYHIMSRCLKDPLADNPEVFDSIVAAAADLDLGMIRFFGGTWYHWRWGVGPADHRPSLKKYDSVWYPWYVSYFGTDELVEFCERIGCVDSAGKPNVMMVTNVLQTIEYDTAQQPATVYWGDRDMAKYEAANWVEYCNGVVDQDLLDTAIEDEWEPSRFIMPADSASSDPPLFSDGLDDVYDVYGRDSAQQYGGPDGHPDFHDNHTYWYNAIEWANGTTCWLCTADDAPTGYFAWLRRYFAWLRAGGDDCACEKPAWQCLTHFTEASYNAPYNIKYWEIGNEVYSHYMNSSIPVYDTAGSPASAAVIYASDCSAFSTAMKAKDADILTGVNVIAPGRGEDVETWTDYVLANCGSAADFASGHEGNVSDHLWLEKFTHQGVESERTVWLPESGTYTVRVTAYAEPEDPYTGELDVVLSRGGSPVDSANIPIADHLICYDSAAVGELWVTTPGLHTISLHNPNDDWDAPVFVYRVTVEGPSMPATSIWYPADVEQQLLLADYDTSDNSVFAGRVAELQDACDSVPLFLTEGQYGLDEYSFDPPEARHQMRFKSAFWESLLFNSLSKQSLSTYCQFNLVNADSVGLLQDPDKPHTQAETTLMRPNYHFLAMVKDLVGANMVESEVASGTPCFTDLSAYPDVPRWTTSGSTWGSKLPKPSGVKYLDVATYKKSTKLYVLAANWKNGEATTTIDLGTTSVDSEATVKTLKVTNLQNRASAIGNVDKLFEALNETCVYGASPPQSLTPDDVEIVEDEIEDADSTFTYTFEPTSITLIELTLTQ